jgi:hypothetical protein
MKTSLAVAVAFALLALASLSVCEAAITADAVEYVPGFNGTLPSKWYSGYIAVSSTKFLHCKYWILCYFLSPACFSPREQPRDHVTL